jgi:hypothetical protein
LGTLKVGIAEVGVDKIQICKLTVRTISLLQQNN